MRDITPGYIPDILFELGHDSPLRGMPDNGTDDQQIMQKLTTAYITSMYYSALANQYLQGALPDEQAEVDDQMPRLKIAVERSYTDFMIAAEWLKKHDGLISTSPAKAYYDELIKQGTDSIKNIDSFYAN